MFDLSQTLTIRSIINEKIIIQYLLEFILTDLVINDLYYLYNNQIDQIPEDKLQEKKEITKEEIKNKILGLSIDLNKFNGRNTIKNAEIKDLIITQDRELLLYLKGIDIGIGSKKITPKAWFLKFKNRVEKELL